MVESRRRADDSLAAAAARQVARHENSPTDMQQWHVHLAGNDTTDDDLAQVYYTTLCFRKKRPSLSLCLSLLLFTITENMFGTSYTCFCLI